MSDEEPRLSCSVCGTAEGQPHPYRHKFTSGDVDTSFLGEGKKSDKRGPTQPRVSYAGDVALRHLLLQKGLITQSELQEANDTVQALLGRPRAADDRG